MYKLKLTELLLKAKGWSDQRKSAPAVVLRKSKMLQIKAFSLLILLFAASLFVMQTVHAGAFTVFGPETIARIKGHPEQAAFKFAIADPSLTYSIIVQSGIDATYIKRKHDDDDGEHKNKRKHKKPYEHLVINGQPVISEGYFTDAVTVYESAVSLTTENVLKASPLSEKGAYLDITLMGKKQSGESFLVVGPLRVMRLKRDGLQTTYIFPVRDANAIYEVRAASADTSRKHKKAEVKIEINNQPVHLDKKDYKDHRKNKEYTKDKTLSGKVKLQLINTIGIRVKGKSGRYVDTTVIGYDSVAPTITARVEPLTAGHALFETGVKVSFSCSDITSGIASCSEPVEVDMKNGPRTIIGNAVDIAGNKSTSTVNLSYDPVNSAISALISNNGIFTVFGPEVVKRLKGHPGKLGFAFNSENSAQSYELRVTRGFDENVKHKRHDDDDDDDDDDKRKYKNKNNKRGDRSSIEINGTQIVEPGYFTDSVTTFNGAVSLLAENEIHISPDKKKGSYLEVELVGLQQDGSQFTVYGPVKVMRSDHEKLSANFSFDVIDPTAKYEMQVNNGTNTRKHDDDHTTSAKIKLNNATIFRERDFKKHVDTLIKQVTVQKNNTVAISIHGKPRSFITTSVYGYDDVPPTITATIEPQSNKNNWNNTPVVVRFSCDDKTSGITYCSEPITIDSETNGQNLVGKAIDGAGNTATIVLTIKVDLIAPEITGVITPKPNAEGWNNTDLSVSYLCNDNLSGIEFCSPPVQVVNEGAKQIFVGKAVDYASNESTTSVTVSLDKTAPLFSVTPSPAANVRGWNNSPVHLIYSCSDPLSGIATCPANMTVETEGAKQNFAAAAVDVAGNPSHLNTELNIDRALPEILVSVSPSANNADWHKTDVTLNYQCSDSLSGVLSCTANKTIITEGSAQSFTGTVVDNADNSAQVSTVLNIDKTVPTISYDVAPIANSNGWHNTDPTVTFTCDDSLSGVKTCTSPVIVTTETANQLITGNVIDVADNVATTSTTIKLDKTAPVITASIEPAPNAAGWHKTTAVVTFSCNDNLSGIESCSQPVTVDLETASQLITGTAVDKAGNTSETSVTIKLDKTVPTISYDVTPATNTNGWYNSDPTVTFTCNDNLSGVKTCTSPVTVTTETANQLITGNVIDVADNVASASTTIKLDKTAPVITASIEPLPNAADWHKTTAVVKFSCNDSLSGIESCSQPVTVDLETAGQVITGTAVDKAGNTSETSVTIKLDKTVPMISYDVTPTANTNGWHNADPTINFTCNDSLSGIATCTSPVTVTSETANQLITGNVIDVADNVATTSTTIKLDKTAPVITASIEPFPNAAGWHKTTAVVTFSCTDNLSGIESCSQPVTVDLETASQFVTGTAVDKAGNTTETSVTIKLDKTAPQISIAPSATANSADWFNADTTLITSCSDTLSGIVSCPDVQAVNTEGAGQTFNVSTQDIAGNNASASITINLDKTAPIITSQVQPIANANGWHNSDVTVSYTCDDVLSGVASCTETQNISTEGAAQTFTGTVVDVASNSTSTSVNLNIDKTAPQLAFITPLNNSVQTVNPPLVTIALSDNLAIDNTSLEIVVNGLLVTAQCQFANQQAVCSLPAAIDDTGATITAQVSDLALNSSTATTTFVFDSDADGVIDAEDVFPFDPTEWADLDGDGIGDNADPDRDGDGFTNEHETISGFDPNDSNSTPPDLDGDFIPDSIDLDRDGDGHNNDLDAFPDNDAEWFDLDGDGTGDNADPDRDGDGFSNVDEELAGTNPGDANDYPDTTPPVVTLNGDAQRVTEFDLIDLTGTVTDSGKGVASVVITSDRFAGLNFSAIINGDQWSTTVPLEVGSNQLTIVATDVVNNQATLNVVIERENPNTEIGLTIDYPTSNEIVTSPEIVVRGQIRSNKPALQISVLVNGLRAELTPTNQVTIFNFESSVIPLNEGINNITVQGNIDGQALQRSVLVTYQKEEQQISAPEIVVLSPISGSYQTGESITLAGRVTTIAGLKSLTVNNQPVGFNSNSAPDYNFQELLSFAAGESSLNVAIVATDNQDQTSQIHAIYYRDQTAPSIQLEQALLGSSEVNVVREQPYQISGTVTDSNLASFFINNKEVGLSPAGNGVYSFNEFITLDQVEPVDLTLTASDQAGNQTSQSYILQLDAAVSVSILRPENNSEILSTGIEQVLPITARIEGNVIPENITINATLFNASGLSVNTASLTVGDAGLATGEITIPAVAGDYSLQVEVLDSNGELLSKTQHQLKVIDEQLLTLELSKIEPANNDKGIEPNTFISVFFNKPIDITKFKIKVHETAHGKTYIDVDELGTDGIKAKGYQLQEVNRDYMEVTGNISVLPNNQIVAFYPETDFAYGGTVFVDVEYDGEELIRSQFKTRTLPTFVTGYVVDQLNQNVPNVEVSIPELSRTTKTNSDGAFSFGYGESEELTIPGGSFELVVNNGLKNPLFGSVSQTINIQKHYKNNLSMISIPILNRDIPFVPAVGRETLNLLQGAMKYDLSQADLQFPDGRRQGDIHTQMLTFSQIAYPVDPVAIPLFAYTTQPSGIEIEGDVAVDMSIPKLNNAYDHVPDDGYYVLIVGLSPEFGRIMPVGVGEIQNNRVISRGKLHLKNLDYIGYGLSPIQAQPIMQRYINDEIGIEELIIEVRQIQAQ